MKIYLVWTLEYDYTEDRDAYCCCDPGSWLESERYCSECRARDTDEPKLFAAVSSMTTAKSCRRHISRKRFVFVTKQDLF